MAKTKLVFTVYVDRDGVADSIREDLHGVSFDLEWECPHKGDFFNFGLFSGVDVGQLEVQKVLHQPEVLSGLLDDHIEVIFEAELEKVRALAKFEGWKSFGY